ncbi:MAG: cutinase family protein [Solirubrobacterales bacterium]|nr:cutinase family protein [Solirubrobacterales bacterium]
MRLTLSGRRTRPRWRARIGGSALAVALLGALVALPATAAALTGPQLLTFGDQETDTEISTQYEGLGVIFKDENGYYPEVKWDNAAFTNPVLSGTFGFNSPITAEFVVPGTTTPATVENLAMDVGYIDEPGSTELIVNRTNGPFVLYANEYGFNHLSLGGGAISGFKLQGNEEDPHGFELDNLAYTIPVPPPPPPVAAPAPSCPTYQVFDSRGSGEDHGLSKPGSDFVTGFLQRFRSLKNASTLSLNANPYPAVGVFSWTHWRQDVNGLGAFLGVNQLGAYHASESVGKAKVRAFVTNTIMGACGGQSKLVLLGYSQGAQATADAYQELSPGQRTRIAAVVLWGDPRYNHADDPADRDNRRWDGSLGTRQSYPDEKSGRPSRVFSYCNKHDPICQNGLEVPELLHYKLNEHSLYWSTDEAKNDGSAVASYLVGNGG